MQIISLNFILQNLQIITLLTSIQLQSVIIQHKTLIIFPKIQLLLQINKASKIN